MDNFPRESVVRIERTLTRLQELVETGVERKLRGRRRTRTASMVSETKVSERNKPSVWFQLSRVFDQLVGR